MKIVALFLSLALSAQSLADQGLPFSELSSDPAEVEAAEIHDDLLFSGEMIQKSLTQTWMKAHQDRKVPNADLQSAEDRLLNWKQEIELQASQLSDSPFASRVLGDITHKYFALVSQLLIIRILIHEDHSRSWLDRFAMQFSKRLYEQLALSGVTAKNQTNDEFFYFKNTQSKDNVFLVNLSQAAALSLEVGTLTDYPSDEGFATLTRYLVIRDQLEKIAELRLITQDQKVATPKISLSDSLQNFGSMQDHAAEYEALARKQVQAKAFAKALKTSIDIKGILKRTSSQMGTFFSGQNQSTTIEKALIERIEQATQQNLLAQRSLEQLSIREMKALVAESIGTAVIQGVIALVQAETLILNEDTDQLQSFLDQNVEKIRNQLTDDEIESWKKAARAAEKEIYKTHRKNYLNELSTNAKEIKKLNKSEEEDLANLSGTEIKTSALLQSISEGIFEMEPSEQSLMMFHLISGAGTYPDARKTYFEIMSQLLLDTGLNQKSSEEELITASEKQSLKDHYAKKLSENLSGDFKNISAKDSILEKQVDAQIKQIKNLTRFGYLMGFIVEKKGEVAPAEPTLKFISQRHSKWWSWSSMIDSYKDILIDEISSHHPMLQMEVEQNGEKKLFFEILSALSSDEPLAFKALDLGLGLLQKHMKTLAEAVSHSKSLEEMKAIAGNSMLLNLLLKHFPQFENEKDHFVRSLKHQSLNDFFVRSYLGPYIGYGFGAMMLIQVPLAIKNAMGKKTPILGAINAGVDPFIKIFMKLVPITLSWDLIHYYGEVQEEKKIDQQSQGLFFSSPDATWVTYTDMREARSTYNLSYWMLVARGFIDVPFIGAGIKPVRALSKAVWSMRPTMKARLQRDLLAFRALGLNGGEWKKLDRGLSRILKNKHRLSKRTIKNAVKAHKHLSKQLAKGKDWNPELMIQKSNTQINRELYQRLKQLENQADAPMGPLQPAAKTQPKIKKTTSEVNHAA